MIQDIFAVLFLVVLEGLLSFDNALALAAMVRHLPATQQKRALYYGMVGAFVFRFIALWFVTFLMQNIWVKFLGGTYLLGLAVKYFFFGSKEDEGKSHHSVFWRTVIIVELTDIAFSIDSILAAVAVSQTLWVVVVGGILGIIMMRFAASIFINLIAKFPRLEDSAFLLVGIVGVKLTAESQGHHIPAWIVWGLMALALLLGFTKKEKKNG